MLRPSPPSMREKLRPPGTPRLLPELACLATSFGRIGPVTAERGERHRQLEHPGARRRSESGDLQDFLLVERFVLQQRFGQLIELWPLLTQEPHCLRIRLVQHPSYFGIDQARRVVAVRAPSTGHPGPAFRRVKSEKSVGAVSEGNRTELVAHAPAGDHLPHDARRLLHVAFGTGGARAIDDVLRGSSAHGADNPRVEVRLVVVVAGFPLPPGNFRATRPRSTTTPPPPARWCCGRG